jgi:lauroyl/myristoyl acyltransferase
LDHALQSVDYGMLLPALARTPLVVGEPLAYLRGLLQGLFDYEWRSMAQGRRYIRAATYQAMNFLLPEAGKRQWVSATLLRFMHNSREEWQACLFGSPVMSRIAGRSSVEGLERLLEIRDEGRGLVLVSCHFDSFCMGMVLLGMNGLRTNVVITAIVEDPRVHPMVRRFFQRKYRGMERHMGGRMVSYEVNLRFFYRALERGETVILLGDIPGSKPRAHIPFLGRNFNMPLGAWHMARKTGSPLGAYVCLHQAPGTYRVVCHPPEEVGSRDPVEALTPVYAFLETWIKRFPERWVAAELLPGYGELQ